MSSTCSCAQHVKKLNQQISVMRKEIKNLRHLIDSAVRSHRKHLDSLLSALSHSEQLGVRLYPKPDQKVQDGEGISLEEGNIQTVPIGYISSCFPGKNGTPRQPGICGQSRATLRIEASIFNNPHHALIGLEHYSHVWVIFLFHKNGRLSCKAKVKPPRLNGQRVGVYSTRSPHRPNALGLTLAKLECITGDTLHLSGIDMIAGTPVLDIKPYIPEYDSPSGRTDFGNTVCPETEVSHSGGRTVLSEEEGRGFGFDVKEVSAGRSGWRRGQGAGGESTPLASRSRAEPFEGRHDERHGETEVCYSEAPPSQVASWVRAPPVASLAVRLTPHAETELRQFQPPGKTEPGRPSFRFLRGPEEAEAAIRDVLRADPRSVYRRTRCPDRLFYFVLDSAHITCWFGGDFAEVVRVRPAEPVPAGPEG
ncbi:hypothetical protein ANANG_G00095540 [Anguilla anguilla]|uniref:tRNA (adenine(37)-N6)-methyltransferase n=1 Tax=Anguilla anguilla TaxID=7936 RepID=A0A9D3MFQ5_ANGAN|nr:hypothetical protein ANANG_G00095540 [Anguilla anguilla]